MLYFATLSLLSRIMMTDAYDKSPQNYDEEYPMETQEQSFNRYQTDLYCMPRVNVRMMRQRVGRMVSIVGAVDPNQHGVFVDGEGERFQIALQSPIIQIHMQQERKMHIPPKFQQKYVEWGGRVNENGTLNPSWMIYYGNDFGLKTWNKFVQLVQDFPDLFAI